MYELFKRAVNAEIGVELIPEYKFHPVRRWRIDYALPEKKIAIEIDGGVWTNGRHTRGAGFKKDMEKTNALAADGWLLLRFTPSELNTVYPFDIIKQAIKTRDNERI